MHLSDLVPEADAVVTLDPDELGPRILQVLAKWSPQSGMNIEIGYFTNVVLQGYGPTLRRNEIRQAIHEAWSWLEGQGLLVTDQRFRGAHGMRVLSRKARELANEGTGRTLRKHRLPKDMLHRAIRDDVWALYQREKYGTAVLEAMRAVEVAVRDAAGLSAREIGTPLMRTAFDVKSGSLTDRTAVVAEREAMSNLFAGAIGAYKNPHSHRKVALENPDEAAEIILLANHLLRIVDARRPQKA